MKSFMYFFEKNNLQLNDSVFDDFDLNFKKSEVTLAPSVKGLNSAPGTFVKLQNSETALKYNKEEQTWNFIEEKGGIKLYIGWYNSEFDEITGNLDKLLREKPAKKANYLKCINFVAPDDKRYKVPLLLFLPQSMRYNNKGELEKAYSRRFPNLLTIGEKYYMIATQGGVSFEDIEVYKDIAEILNVFYNINKYDLLYSGLFDEIAIIEFFEEVLCIQLLIDIIKENKEIEEDAQKKSTEKVPT